MSDKPRVYVETSTISFLTSRPSRNIHISTKQELTRKWWEQRERYELFISTTVIEEIMEGDYEASKARLSIARGITCLPFTDEVNLLANTLVEAKAVPKKSEMDASHIAHAAVHGMDFLITWNQKHIATDKKQKMIEAIIVEYGFKPPQLLTPERHLLYEET